MQAGLDFPGMQIRLSTQYGPLWLLRFGWAGKAFFFSPVTQHFQSQTGHAVKASCQALHCFSGATELRGWMLGTEALIQVLKVSQRFPTSRRWLLDKIWTLLPTWKLTVLRYHFWTSRTYSQEGFKEVLTSSYVADRHCVKVGHSPEAWPTNRTFRTALLW